MVDILHNGIGHKLAVPRNRDEIRRDAYLLRQSLGLLSEPHFPILHFLENVLPETDPDFCLEIVEDDELPGRHAETVPLEKTIRVRNCVYEAAACSFWWARSILAHELGHYYFHNEKSVRYATLDPVQKVPPDFDPEHQADVFAAELLAPIHLIKGQSLNEVAKNFGVSRKLAKCQLYTVDKICKKQDAKKRKRKRPDKQSSR